VNLSLTSLSPGCQFALVTATRTLLLRAASHAEAVLWVEGLRQRLGCASRVAGVQQRLGERTTAASAGETQQPAGYGTTGYGTAHGAAAYGGGAPSLLCATASSLLCASLLDEHDSPPALPAMAAAQTEVIIEDFFAARSMETPLDLAQQLSLTPNLEPEPKPHHHPYPDQDAAPPTAPRTAPRTALWTAPRKTAPRKAVPRKAA